MYSCVLYKRKFPINFLHVIGRPWNRPNKIHIWTDVGPMTMSCLFSVHPKMSTLSFISLWSQGFTSGSCLHSPRFWITELQNLNSFCIHSKGGWGLKNPLVSGESTIKAAYLVFTFYLGKCVWSAFSNGP